MDAVVLSRLLSSRKPNEVAAARAVFAQAGPPAADIVANVLERARKKRVRRARLVAPLVCGSGVLAIIAAFAVFDFAALFFCGDGWGNLHQRLWLPSPVELEAAGLLARWGDVRAADTLIAALDDPKVERAEAARRALAELLTGLDERTAASELSTEHGARLRRLLTEETEQSRPAHPELALALLNLIERVCAARLNAACRATHFYRTFVTAALLQDVERLSARATDLRVRAACVDCLPGLRAVAFGGAAGASPERIKTP